MEGSQGDHILVNVSKAGMKIVAKKKKKKKQVENCNVLDARIHSDGLVERRTREGYFYYCFGTSITLIFPPVK